MTVTNPANGTFTTSGEVTFPDRYGYVEVVNNDTTKPMYARTDGSAPSATGAAGDYEILPGDRALIPNSAQFWWQGFGNASGTSANPGTTVKLASANASAVGYEVIGR